MMAKIRSMSCLPEQSQCSISIFHPGLANLTRFSGAKKSNKVFKIIYELDNVINIIDEINITPRIRSQGVQEYL